MKRKKEMVRLRLPMEAVQLLRHKGGAHSSPKGKKGYDRKQEKQNLRQELKSCLPFKDFNKIN